LNWLDNPIKDFFRAGSESKPGRTFRYSKADRKRNLRSYVPGQKRVGIQGWTWSAVIVALMTLLLLATLPLHCPAVPVNRNPQKKADEATSASLSEGTQRDIAILE
jgi:hypothetical protein